MKKMYSEQRWLNNEMQSGVRGNSLLGQPGQNIQGKSEKQALYFNPVSI
jgi:hypothetical protein